MIKCVFICMIVLFALPELAESNLITVGQNESIQAAIYGANQGDTILVNAGTYYENLNLNKSIILQGVGMPVIDGRGNGRVITLASGNSRLIGFMIKNSSKSFKEDGCIVITSNNNTIKSNIVENCSSGIILFNCSNNTLVNNKVIKNIYGFSLHNSRYNTIDANNAVYNDYGILLNASNNNAITTNSFILSNKNGITLRYSENNNLTGNNASLNNRYGINIEDSDFNTFINNTCLLNKDTGVYLKKSHDNVISRSMANNNDYGIYLRDGRRNIVSGNIIRNNRGSGIKVFNSSYSSFWGNNASNNAKNGVELISGNNDIIKDNEVNYNKGFGISFKNFKNEMIIGNNASYNLIGIVLLENNDNTIKKNNASYNDLSGIFIELGFDNTIAGNTASNNLGGIIITDSKNNSFINNTAINSSAAIALQHSSNNTFLSNNASYNRVGMYLNRSNSSRIAENELRHNMVGIALNFSDISSSENNNLSETKYIFLINENDTISKYFIWKETVISEHMERYLLMHDEAITGSSETSFVHPAPRPSAKKSSGSPRLPVSIDSNPRGAEIWIDGKSSMAVTPNKIVLGRKGNHEIELFLSGYESKKEIHYINSPTSIKMDLNPIHLTQYDDKNGRFVISTNSTPEGASIWIDGNFTGKNTPSIIYFDSPGNHTYELFLSGYETYQGNISTKEAKSIDARMIAKNIGSEAMLLTDSENKTSGVPGFLSWHTLLAFFLVYYLKFFKR